MKIQAFLLSKKQYQRPFSPCFEPIFIVYTFWYIHYTRLPHFRTNVSNGKRILHIERQKGRCRAAKGLLVKQPLFWPLIEDASVSALIGQTFSMEVVEATHSSYKRALRTALLPIPLSRFLHRVLFQKLKKRKCYSAESVRCLPFFGCYFCFISDRKNESLF